MRGVSRLRRWDPRDAFGLGGLCLFAPRYVGGRPGVTGSVRSRHRLSRATSGP
jgi:hypothetical protein